MQKIVLSAIGAALLCTPAIALAQTKAATYITKEEVDTVNKQTGTDRTIRVLDIGHENFAVGIIHRGPTGGGGGAGGRGGAAGGAAATPEPCGEKPSSPPPAGTPTGLFHDSQTEGYYIISGAGTMVTGGHIVNGRKSAADAAVTTTLNGPSCSGSIMGSDVVLGRQGRRHHHHSGGRAAWLDEDPRSRRLSELPPIPARADCRLRAPVDRRGGQEVAGRLGAQVRLFGDGQVLRRVESVPAHSDRRASGRRPVRGPRPARAGRDSRHPWGCETERRPSDGLFEQIALERALTRSVKPFR